MSTAAELYSKQSLQASFVGGGWSIWPCAVAWIRQVVWLVADDAVLLDVAHGVRQY